MRGIAELNLGTVLGRLPEGIAGMLTHEWSDDDGWN
jgi:hypothetical protein